MAENPQSIRPVPEPEEPTIRFTIDPELLKKAEREKKDALEDTYVGAPLLPPEQPPEQVRPVRGRKWVKLAAGCAAAAVILCAALLLAPRGRDAQQTALTFLDAVETADYAMLAKVAEGNGVTLTEENTAPLFALYREDDAFRKSLREVVLSQAEAGTTAGGMFSLVDRSSKTHRQYAVVITPGQAVVRSNLQGAQITVGDLAAVWDAKLGAATADGLLPGDYPVSGVYDAPYGDEFRAEAVVRVAQPHSGCELAFDYASMEVYNSAPEPVQISVGGSQYATLEPEQELTISPLAPETQVVAVNPGEQTLSATAQEGYFYVYFDQCQVVVYNDFHVPMQISRGGKEPVEIAPLGSLTITDATVGEELTALLIGSDGLKPYVYQVEYEYDDISPVFELSDEQFEDLRLTVETYTLVAYEAYARGETLAELTPSQLTRELDALLAQPEPPVLVAGSIMLSAYSAPQPLTDGGVRLGAQVTVEELPAPPVAGEEAEQAPPGTVKTWQLEMELRDGLWTVLPEQEPPEETEIEAPAQTEVA